MIKFIGDIKSSSSAAAIAAAATAAVPSNDVDGTDDVKDGDSKRKTRFQEMIKCRIFSYFFFF
jgi:hypothetical protein